MCWVGRRYFGRREVRLPTGHSRPCRACRAASAFSDVSYMLIALSLIAGIQNLAILPAKLQAMKTAPPIRCQICPCRETSNPACLNQVVSISSFSGVTIHDTASLDWLKVLKASSDRSRRSDSRRCEISSKDIYINNPMDIDVEPYQCKYGACTGTHHGPRIDSERP